MADGYKKTKDMTPQERKPWQFGRVLVDSSKSLGITNAGLIGAKERVKENKMRQLELVSLSNTQRLKMGLAALTQAERSRKTVKLKVEIAQLSRTE